MRAMTERTAGDPQTEHMNNFYMYMPGGLFRANSFSPDSMVSAGARYMMDKFGSLLDQPEDSWIPQNAEAIRKLKRSLEVQAAIDELLGDDPRLRAIVVVRVVKKGAHWNREDDVLIRPLYVRLRERFSETDLIG